ncbi:hypothetical protein EEDFHM_04606 [Methylorubrum populi]
MYDCLDDDDFYADEKNFHYNSFDEAVTYSFLAASLENTIERIPNSYLYRSDEDEIEGLQEEYRLVQSHLSQCDCVSSFIAALGTKNYRMVRDVMNIIDAACDEGTSAVNCHLLTYH